MAFHLGDLLLVLALLAAFIGLLLPAVQKARADSARTQSENNLKQMGIAMHNIVAHHNGCFPPGWGPVPFYRETEPSLGFFTHLLPYIEQESLYKLITAHVITAALDNAPSIPTYVAPADFFNSTSKSPGLSSYAVNYGASAPAMDGVNGSPPLPPEGNLFGNKVALCLNSTFMFKGTSNTVGVYEYASGTARAWLTDGVATDTWNVAAQARQPVPQLPAGPAMNVGAPTIFSPETAQALLIDGTVRCISSTIEENTWLWACDPMSLAPPPADW